MMFKSGDLHSEIFAFSVAMHVYIENHMLERNGSFLNTPYSAVNFIQLCYTESMNIGYCRETVTALNYRQKICYRNIYCEGGDCLDIEDRGWVV